MTCQRPRRSQDPVLRVSCSRLAIRLERCLVEHGAKDGSEFLIDIKSTVRSCTSTRTELNLPVARSFIRRDLIRSYEKNS